MKKVMIAVSMMLGIGLAQVSAQNVSFGVKAEANTSNFILSDLDPVESKLGFGASLGGFAKFDLTENFAVQPELLFHFKNSTTESGNDEDNFHYWGAEIPVYALGQWNCGNGKFLAGVGPYVALGFNAEYDDSDFDLYEEIGNTDESTLRRFDFGFGATLGYEFGNGIQINAGYKLGVLDAMDAGRNDASMLPQTISLGLGYRF